MRFVSDYFKVIKLVLVDASRLAVDAQARQRVGSREICNFTWSRWFL
jgi:hypothetical protein